MIMMWFKTLLVDFYYLRIEKRLAMKCDRCGKNTLINYGNSSKNLCEKCADSSSGSQQCIHEDQNILEGRVDSNSDVNRGVASESDSQATPWMGVVGVLLLVAGAYFLFVDPGAPSSSGIVNLQKMSIGQTFSIIGSIFVGFQWRPR
ncbi:hypothetical protein [Halomonas kalidii]|uniref:Transmembrane protein n=1 Tax=Halomonas kalidii TaxID=3043293 RepID=A0ABT6VPI7_9GAMM|nr:hypothetical protein [Halomonas kalidii]MDI5934671.1 hypothetical protein [Halomonas kalidii]